MQAIKPDDKLFIKNRQKLYSLLKPGSLAILNSNDEMMRNGDQYFPFRQNSDLYYLTGINQEKTQLILCKDKNEKTRAFLFIREPNPKLETWEGRKLRKEEAMAISGIDEIRFSNDFFEFARDKAFQYEYIYVNLVENPKKQDEYHNMDQRVFRQMQNIFPLHGFERLAPLLEQLRLRKEPEEIKIMQEAITITGNAFQRVLNILKPGIKEHEIEAELTHEFIKSGARGHAYPPIVASGENACYLHYIKNSGSCDEGDLLLLDFGAELSNYAADLSRTIPVNGKYTQRQKDLYLACLDVFYHARDLMAPGITINEINEQVGKYWEEKHISLNLYPRDKTSAPDGTPMWKKYYPHGTSHYLGLDVHDVGKKNIPLAPGMVLSCEPGIYIPDEAIGIRIENDILITETGYRDLMENIPLTPGEIEEIMQTKTNR
ncbi:MAG: aminopeptidase P N-terminal domain-containing protein [Bacteroidales bacterium]